MLGALTSRTRATTDALLREARFDAATVHELHSAGEPSPSWSNGSCDITVLLFTTKIKQCVPFSPPHNCSFKLEIAFCVRGVTTAPCGVPFPFSPRPLPPILQPSATFESGGVFFGQRSGARRICPTIRGRLIQRSHECRHQAPSSLSSV